MAHIVNNFNKALRRQARAAEAPATSPSKDRALLPDTAENAAAADLPAASAAVRRSADPAGLNAQPVAKRIKSPSTSLRELGDVDGDGDGDGDDGPGRETSARLDKTMADFPARPATKAKGKIWNEGDPHLPRTAASGATASGSQSTPKQPRTRHLQGPFREPAASQIYTEEEDPSVTVMIQQPETRPISQEQLVAEVKGIYSGLVMVETKCTDLDNKENAKTDGSAPLNNEQWQALIALHRTLLHEHHDFFLASQHPSASPALRRLAQKYAMPARMWRHGIHSFLELLRHRLPASYEHMLTFIYLAYSMMALLYETVPAFEDTWIECLGDLGRYRMAIEEEDIRDRDTWTGVSRYWYSKASDKAPTTGRLYHHLAILARPNAVQQTFYYTKSLCCAVPFKSARDSILTLFEPILHGTPNRLPRIDTAFVKTHAILFIASNTDTEVKPLLRPLDELMREYSTTKANLVTLLKDHIATSSKDWLEPGAFMAIANTNALLEYGKTEPNTQGQGNVIMPLITPRAESGDAHMDDGAGDVHMDDGAQATAPAPSRWFGLARDLNRDCDALIFRRYGDNNVLSYMNARLSFLRFVAGKDAAAMRHLEGSVPWALLANMLTSLTIGFKHFGRVESPAFPRPSERPLCEDFSLRGLLWTDALFPPDWFDSARVAEDEKAFELPSMVEYRRERVLWLGWNLAAHRRWIAYDDKTKQFRATPAFHQEAHHGGSENAAALAEKEDAMSFVSTADSTDTMFGDCGKS